MVCKICGASVPENSMFCENCGSPLMSENGQSAMIYGQGQRTEQDVAETKPEETAAYSHTPVPASAPAPKPEPAPEKHKPKKKLGWIVAVVCVLLLAVGLVAGYFLIHFWEPATCTKPAYCKICGVESGKPDGHTWKSATCTDPQYCTVCEKEGDPALGHKWNKATCEEPKTCDRCDKTQGEPKGHKWKEATCEKPETCSTCKKTQGTALGHDWEPATYQQKKTCKRCGDTEGTVLGYIGDVRGRWTDELFKRNYARAHVVQLDRRLENCFRFRLDMEIGDLDYGSPYGKWQIYVRDDNGDWVKIMDFKLETMTQSVYVELSKPVSFRDVAVVGQFNRNASFRYNYEICEVQCRVD